ncbi:MAG TPA: YdcF family protein [Candidatus Paceibacterota bacterium]|nr:YdcF family protein [Candidatus Paceibacterota bacterium]
MDLTYLDARPLYKWLTMRDKLTGPADAIFVLGAGSLSPLHQAMDLYKGKWAPKISFLSLGGTFGGNLIFGQTEMEMYFKELCREHIPASDMLFAPGKGLTTNTLEEARAAVPFLEERLGRKPSRIILCSRPVHQRRAWATFQKQNPGVRFLNQPSEEELSVELLPRMLQEVERIEKYGAQGDLEPQEIPDWVRELCNKIRTLPVPA